MAKIRVRNARGTGYVYVDSEDGKWQGEEFKKDQAARKEASKDKYITVGRGTSKIKFGDIQSTPTKSTKGLWVSSGRGTGKRKLSK
ncbi:hypothetical protein [Nitrosopumilus sp. S4]